MATPPSLTVGVVNAGVLGINANDDADGTFANSPCNFCICASRFIFPNPKLLKLEGGLELRAICCILIYYLLFIYLNIMNE